MVPHNLLSFVAQSNFWSCNIHFVHVPRSIHATSLNTLLIQRLFLRSQNILCMQHSPSLLSQKCSITFLSVPIFPKTLLLLTRSTRGILNIHWYKHIFVASLFKKSLRKSFRIYSLTGHYTSHSMSARPILMISNLFYLLILYSVSERHLYARFSLFCSYPWNIRFTKYRHSKDWPAKTSTFSWLLTFVNISFDFVWWFFYKPCLTLNLGLSTVQNWIKYFHLTNIVTLFII